ncbi:MAG: hypothetical protein HDQ88_00730 [Clostridia bacterium]|nr:hypothetical protein [Clostridia bacterium]
MMLNAIQAVPPTYPIRVKLEDIAQLTSPSVGQWLLGLIPVVIAVLGLWLSLYVYQKEKKDALALNEATRRLELFKTLVLDHIISGFHDSFSCLKTATDKLTDRDCDENHRDEVEIAVQSQLRDLNEEVLSLFRAIDSELFANLLAESDKCRDSIIESLADDTVALHVLENYKTNILTHINNARESMIRLIYEYKG